MHVEPDVYGTRRALIQIVRAHWVRYAEPMTWRAAAEALGLDHSSLREPIRRLRAEGLLEPTGPLAPIDKSPWTQEPWPDLWTVKLAGASPFKEGYAVLVLAVVLNTGHARITYSWQPVPEGSWFRHAGDDPLAWEGL